MNLENLVRSIKRMARNTALVLAVAAPLALGACGKDDNYLNHQACVSNNAHEFEKAGHLICKDEKKKTQPQPPEQPTNQIPTASIGMDFGDGLTGKVNYLLAGTDTDGTVGDVYARKNSTPTNSTPWERYSNGEAIQVPIIQGDNSLEIYAVDDKGAESEHVTRGFYSPVDKITEVRPVIRQVLTNKINYVQFSEGATYDLNETESVPDIDFLIEREPGKYSAVIYASHPDDLDLKKQATNTLRENEVPTLLLVRTPNDFTENSVLYFADQNYN